MYDVTDLFRQLFPNTETHPAIHTHEVALYLLKESDYAQYVQMFMHMLDVDESIDTLLILQKLSISEPSQVVRTPLMDASSVPSLMTPTEPTSPTQQPTQPPTQQRSFAGLQRGFLTNTAPRPPPQHYSDLANIVPCDASNIPLVGVHLRDTTGDPVALKLADAEMRRHFEDLQYFHAHRAD